MSDAVPAVKATDIEDGEVKKGRRFDARDFQTIAEYVHDEYSRRKQDPDRRHLEKVWKQIDRQLRMEPDLRRKQDINGAMIQSLGWMAEMELPLQSQTLEVLTADTRKLMFPDSGLWFEAHAALTDTYLKRVDFTSLVAGDEIEVPSQINQDNADKLVEGWLEHYHKQYDFRGTWDKLHAEAFKYGTFVGRGRIVTKTLFIDTAQGVVKRDQKIPVLFAQSVKNVLLDKSPHKLLNEGMLVGPAPIRFMSIKLADLQMQAAKGGTSPDAMDGGWMAANTKDLIGDDRGHIELLEYEGDLVVPRKTTRSVFLPNVIVTVATSGDGPKCVRFRFNKLAMGSYLIEPYHIEGADEVYGVSPLMKGMPIQMAATDALNRLMDWATLNVQPPIMYTKDDPFFAQSGGPIVAPRELWATTGKVEPIKIGDGGALSTAYAAFLKQYDDVTGVNAPRLGERTVSHTTAFAKNVETQRGQARTVDYVDTVLSGPCNRWLQMEVEMGKDAMGSREETFFIGAYGGWVTIDKTKLPDLVAFEVYGAGEPQEELAKQQKLAASMQQAFQLDQMKVQLGGQPMDYAAIQKQILLNGGWQDVDLFLPKPKPQPPAASPGVPGGAAGTPFVPSPAVGAGLTANTALARQLG